jgi:hypothetical protein
MKHSEALRDLNQLLKANPPLDPSHAVVSTVKAEAFQKALPRLIEMGAGYPLFLCPFQNGVLFRVPIRGETEFTVFVETADAEAWAQNLASRFHE